MLVRILGTGDTGAIARRYPGFAEYERKTTRIIPVIALIPSAATPR